MSPFKTEVHVFQVLLGYESEEVNQNVKWQCGGALISATHVLTAAHCIPRGSPPVIARLGSLTTNLPYEKHRQERSITDLFIHPDYSSSARANDIAILKLNSSIDMSNPTYVYPACLDTRMEPFKDRSGTVCGFGIDECEF